MLDRSQKNKWAGMRWAWRAFSNRYKRPAVAVEEPRMPGEDGVLGVTGGACGSSFAEVCCFLPLPYLLWCWDLRGLFKAEFFYLCIQNP